MALESQRQSEESRFAIEKLVAQIQRGALPAGLGTIHQSRNGCDIVSRKRRFDLNPEILHGYEFQLELLPERVVGSGLFRKSSRARGLEFAFTGIADIRADHETVDVLGVDALSESTSGMQEYPQHRHPDC